MISINPYTGKLLNNYHEHSTEDCNAIIEQTYNSWKKYKNSNFSERALLMYKAANILIENKDYYAELITSEMGKVIRESVAEIEKCAWVCRYYAENAEDFLAQEEVNSDAKKSIIAFEPLGIVLAIMPWNFPFWQVFRFAAPALMAGNAALLKHASNVTGCSYAIEEIFLKAGFPENIFRILAVPGNKTEDVIKHPLVRAITLTGSENAGSSASAQAGKYLKKSVLELGGSDPFIVLKDADIDKAANTAVNARMLNAGQSCIAAKRFIVAEEIYDTFIEKVTKRIQNLKSGDPANQATDIGPLAKKPFAEDIIKQVKNSLKMGAKLICGDLNVPENSCFFMPALLVDVSEDMPVFKEETFGPVLSVIRFSNEQEAIRIANNTSFGLGASIWTENRDKAHKIAREIDSGSVFINEMVKSDPRLPFGGIKNSGYGRELSKYGIREFVNIKTICQY